MASNLHFLQLPLFQASFPHSFLICQLLRTSCGLVPRYFVFSIYLYQFQLLNISLPTSSINVLLTSLSLQPLALFLNFAKISPVTLFGHSSIHDTGFHCIHTVELLIWPPASVGLFMIHYFLVLNTFDSGQTRLTLHSPQCSQLLLDYHLLTGLIVLRSTPAAPPSFLNVRHCLPNIPFQYPLSD